MQVKTVAISPGSAEVIVFEKPTDVVILMTSDEDVVWLAAAEGPLDIERAIRLDKAQCPLRHTWAGPLVIHSPAQGARTVQVSILSGGAA